MNNSIFYFDISKRNLTRETLDIVNMGNLTIKANVNYPLSWQTKRTSSPNNSDNVLMIYYIKARHLS